MLAACVTASTRQPVGSSNVSCDTKSHSKRTCVILNERSAKIRARRTETWQRMMRDRRRATNLAVITIIVLAVVVAFTAVIQALRGHFRPLRPIDVAVIVVMLLLVTIMDMMPTRMQLGNFGSTFNVSGTVFVATTIGYGAIIGVIVAMIGTLVTELFARRAAQKLLFN